MRKSNLKPRFSKLAARVLLNLRGEGGDEIERCVDAGKFAKDFHHAPVVFEGMQARPRKQVLSGGGIAVLRLVHMPENNKIDATHPASLSA